MDSTLKKKYKEKIKEQKEIIKKEKLRLKKLKAEYNDAKFMEKYQHAKR